MKKLLFILLLLFSLSEGCTAKPDDASLFTEICNNIFIHIISSDSITLNYNLAEPEKYSIKDFKPTLGNYSEKSFKAEYAYYENILAALDVIDRSVLNEKDRQTYDILKKTFSLYNKSAQYTYFDEPLSPVSGIQAQLPVLLNEYHFYSIDDITDYFSLIKCVPDYFKQICTYEHTRVKKGFCMSPAQIDVIVKQCRNFINNPSNNFLIVTFADRLKKIPGYNGDDADRFIAENRELILNCIIPSYSYLIDELSSLKNTVHKTQSICCINKSGKDYFSLLLKLESGSDKNPEEIFLLFNKTLNECKKKLISIGYTASDANFPYKKPVEILKHLKEAITSEFPALPDSSGNILLKHVHPSLEKTLSPALYISPPIDKEYDDCIYINDALCNRDTLFPTLAHEGFPGHLYQTRYFLGTNPAPVRLVLNFGGYSEGWATYAELLSYDLLKTNHPYNEALKFNKLAILCIYGIIDIGIHYYEWSAADCIKFLIENGIKNTDAGKEIFLTVISEPSLYTKYTLGCLEFINLRKSAEKKYGKSFSAKEFHKKILEIGPCPFNMLDFY